MIHLIDASKFYVTGTNVRLVLKATRLSIPSHRRIGVLGRNGAGKSTLLRMVAGAEDTSTGRIVRTGRISWPLGFAGGFHKELTGVENVIFVARLYDADIDETLAFVEDFAEIGAYIHMPVRTYSSGMRARLAFGLSMAIDFDCYLIDEITGVGDFTFKAKCHDAFQARLQNSGMLMVSHSDDTIRQFCDMALVLHEGALVPFEDVDEAIRFYRMVTG